MYVGDWPYDDTKTFSTPNGTPFYVQDKCDVGTNQTVRAAQNSKWAYAQPSLSVASGDQDDKIWYVHFTSGYSAPWAYPGALATGILGPLPAGQGVNSKLYGWTQNTRPTIRYGMIAMDFPQLPYADLIWDIVKTNTFIS